MDNNKDCKCFCDKKETERHIENESFTLTMVNALIAANKRLVAIIITLAVLFTGYIVYNVYTDSRYDVSGQFRANETEEIRNQNERH